MAGIRHDLFLVGLICIHSALPYCLLGCCKSPPGTGHTFAHPQSVCIGIGQSTGRRNWTKTKCRSCCSHNRCSPPGGGLASPNGLACTGNRSSLAHWHGKCTIRQVALKTRNCWHYCFHWPNPCRIPQTRAQPQPGGSCTP